MSDITVTKEYDSEPVKYCSKCLSLKVKYEESIDSEYCADCGCSDIHEAPIGVWEKKYKARYKSDFVKKVEDPKESFVFKMPLNRLKMRVYESMQWEEIIRFMYPGFPKGYSKTDSVILFFDTLIKHGRLNELRLLLYKRFKL